LYLIGLITQSFIPSTGFTIKHFFEFKKDCALTAFKIVGAMNYSKAKEKFIKQHFQLNV